MLLGGQAHSKQCISSKAHSNTLCIGQLRTSHQPLQTTNCNKINHNFTVRNYQRPKRIPTGPKPKRSQICQAEQSASKGDNQSQQKTGSVNDAWELLQNYTKQDAKGQSQALRDSKQQRQALKEAVLLCAENPFQDAGWVGTSNASHELLLGVVTSDARLGVRALRDWCQALDVEFVMPRVVANNQYTDTSISQLKGGVYIRYNSKTKNCQISQYSGQSRGVLVQMGLDQVGHLPLGLFDEKMENPAVQIQ